MIETSSIAPLVASKVQSAAGLGSAQAGGASFTDFLKSGIENVRSAQSTGEEMSIKAMLGKADLTDVVQSVGKAEAMLQTMVSIRDRVLSAYQELLNTRI